VVENAVLSRYRIYHNVLRIHNNMPVKKGERVDGTKCQIRANCVLFPTNAPNVASASLASKILRSESGWLDACKELEELITFQLVGAEGDHDFLLKSMEMSCILKCRPHVLYQRLCIYQHLHPQYTQDVKLPDATDNSFCTFFQSFGDNVAKFTAAALKSVTTIADKTAIDADRYECDDVTQVRTKITTNPIAPDQQIQHDVEMSYSLLSENPLFGTPKTPDKPKDSTGAYLRELADVYCAATNRQLLFYLFDTLSRHDVVYNFAAKVRKDPSSWEAFSKLVPALL
jgi:hypothetical protein